METKYCSKCHQELTVDLFYKNSASKTGYTSRCKKCINSKEQRETKLKKINFAYKNIDKVMKENKAHKVRINNLMKTIKEYEEILIKNNLM